MWSSARDILFIERFMTIGPDAMREPLDEPSDSWLTDDNERNRGVGMDSILCFVCSLTFPMCSRA